MGYYSYFYLCFVNNHVQSSKYIYITLLEKPPLVFLFPTCPICNLYSLNLLMRYSYSTFSGLNSSANYIFFSSDSLILFVLPCQFFLCFCVFPFYLLFAEDSCFCISTSVVWPDEILPLFFQLRTLSWHVLLLLEASYHDSDSLFLFSISAFFPHLPGSKK